MANKIYGNAAGTVLIEVVWDTTLLKWSARPLFDPTGRVDASKAYSACQEVMTRMASAGVVGTVGADPDTYVLTPGLTGSHASDYQHLLRVTFTIDAVFGTPTTVSTLARNVGGDPLRVTAVRNGATYTAMPAIGATLTPRIGTLTGTARVAFTAGVASFEVEYDTPGAAETLSVTLDRSAADAVISSAAFAVTPGPVDSLAFTNQPGNEEATQVIVGETYGVAIEVTAYDAKGNIKTDFTADVVMTITTDPPGGSTLGGTTTQAAVAGVATFDDLTIDKAGAGFVITATSTAAKASDPFEIFA